MVQDAIQVTPFSMFLYRLSSITYGLSLGVRDNCMLRLELSVLGDTITMFHLEIVAEY